MSTVISLKDYYTADEIQILTDVFDSAGVLKHFTDTLKYRIDSDPEYEMVTLKMPLSNVPMYINFFEEYSRTADDDRRWLGLFAKFRLTIGR